MINQLILVGTKQETGYKLFFLSEIREVGEKKRITPYMHVLFAHVPFFLIHINVWKYLQQFT